MVKPFGVALPYQRCGQSITSDQRPETVRKNNENTKEDRLRKTQFAKYLQYFSSILSHSLMMLFLKGDFTFFFLHLFSLSSSFCVFLKCFWVFLFSFHTLASACRPLLAWKQCRCTIWTWHFWHFDAVNFLSCRGIHFRALHSSILNPWSGVHISVEKTVSVKRSNFVKLHCKFCRFKVWSFFARVRCWKKCKPMISSPHWVNLANCFLMRIKS